MIRTILDVTSAVFFLSGCLFALTASVGIVRFPDTMRRMQAATKPQAVAVLLVIAGAILDLIGNVDIWMLLLVAVFTLFTTPVVGHYVGRVAYREQRRDQGLPEEGEMEEPRP
jgi:multicomponent Na+:H+ antiporter subunit G